MITHIKIYNIAILFKYKLLFLIWSTFKVIRLCNILTTALMNNFLQNILISLMIGSQFIFNLTINMR